MKKFTCLLTRLGKLVSKYYGEIRKNVIVMAHYPSPTLSVHHSWQVIFIHQIPTVTSNHIE